MSIKVALHKKPISGKRQSLYLDFYPPIPHPKTGKPTRREFLGLYIFDKPTNPIDKQHNKEMQQMAEQIRQNKVIELNKPEIYTGYEKEQLKIKEQGEKDFITYFKSLADNSTSNYYIWVSAYKYFEAFTKGHLKFAELNESVCNEFKTYLFTAQSSKRTKTDLAQNSAAMYFNKLKAAIRQAYKDGLLPKDLNLSIKTIKKVETRREFLTMEELNSLVKTNCNNPLLKKAALFSAVTGLRFSDIQKLVWGELEYINGEGYFIKFKQQKTKGMEFMPIGEQAYSLLGEPKAPTNKVFEGLNYSGHENKHLCQWIGAAGITKNITFHCFRHTFATLQLSKGTDIYTVSKMLGHRELKTTQIYAQIIDKTKRDAANKIKLDF